MPPILYRGTVAQLRQTIRRAVALMAGREPDPTGLVEGLLLRVGTVALSFIKQAYTDKARGGIDEAGIQWQPLSPKTIAYGRRHPGLSRIRSKVKGTSRERRPLLTAALDKRWRQLYSRAVFGLMRQARLTQPNADIKSHAA